MAHLIPLLLLVFVNTLSFSILLPLLPFIVESFGGSRLEYGILLSAFSAAQFIGAPLLGAWSDRIGRKKVLLVSQLGTTLSWVLFGFAWDMAGVFLWGISGALYMIFFARLLDGITGGNNSVAEAMVIDLVDRSQQTKVFGWMAATFGLGMIIGPAIGSLLSDFWGYGAVIQFEIWLGLLTLIALWIWLPENKVTFKKDGEAWWKQLFVWQKVKRFKNQELSFLVQRKWIFSLVFVGYTSVLVLYVIDRFGLDPLDMAWLFLGIGLTSIVNQLLFLPWLLRRYTEKDIFLFAQVCLAVGLIACMLVDTVGLFLAWYTLAHVGLGLSFSVIKPLLAEQVSGTEKGEVMGIAEGVASLAASFVPFVATLVYVQIGGWIFIVCAMLAAYNAWRMYAHAR